MVGAVTALLKIVDTRTWFRQNLMLMIRICYHMIVSLLKRWLLGTHQTLDYNYHADICCYTWVA